MRQATKVREDIRAGSDHFLRRVNPLIGCPLGELDYLRGHKDDFFGDLLRDEYTSSVNGVGSFIVLLDAAHGGQVSLTAGPGSGRYARLWLGDAADGYDTLDVDDGWVMIVRMKNNTSGGAWAIQFGAADAAGARYNRAGINTLVSAANWMVQTNNGAAGSTVSAVAFDTNWHWHTISAYPITGGYQIDYWLDGGLIVSHTTNIEANARTPYLEVYSLDATLRSANIDFWAVIPRNL